MSDAVQVAVAVIAGLCLVCLGVGAAYFGLVLRGQKDGEAKRFAERKEFYAEIGGIKTSLNSLELTLRGGGFLKRSELAHEIEAAFSKWLVAADERYLRKADMEQIADRMALKLAHGYVGRDECDDKRRNCPAVGDLAKREKKGQA